MKNLPALDVKNKLAKQRKQIALRNAMAKSHSATGGFEIIATSSFFDDDNDIWSHFTTHQLENLFAINSIIFSCVNKTTTAFSEAVLEIGKEVGGEFEALPRHPLLDILNNPNPFMGRSDFDANVISHLLLTGKSYVAEGKNRAGQIVALMPFPTSWVTLKFDQTGNVLIGYEVFQGNGLPPLVIPLEDMTVITLIDPSGIHSAVSPLEAALRDVQTDQERESYIMEMMVHIKAPGLILHQEEGWSPKEKEEARQLLMDRIGRGKRGNPLFTSGANFRLDIPEPLSDLDWPGLANLSETRICSAFGVPPIIIGLRSGLESGTYANFAEAQKTFYRTALVPLWKSIGEAYTRGFIMNDAFLNNELILKYNTSDITQLQEDRNTAAERADSLFNGGLITRDEGRSIAGEEPVGGSLGNVYRIPLNMLEVPADSEPLTEPLRLEEPDTSVPDGDLLEEEVVDDDDLDADDTNNDQINTGEKTHVAKRLRNHNDRLSHSGGNGAKL